MQRTAFFAGNPALRDGTFPYRNCVLYLTSPLGSLRYFDSFEILPAQGRSRTAATRDMVKDRGPTRQIERRFVSENESSGSVRREEAGVELLDRDADQRDIGAVAQMQNRV